MVDFPEFCETQNIVTNISNGELKKECLEHKFLPSFSKKWFMCDLGLILQYLPVHNIEMSLSAYFSIKLSQIDN